MAGSFDRLRMTPRDPTEDPSSKVGKSIRRRRNLGLVFVGAFGLRVSGDHF